MKIYMRKVSKNEILKAMECFDRYPYIPFWYIIKQISEHPSIANEDLNYWFKYGYGHPEQRHIMRAYDPNQEMQEIYKHIENYINRKEENLPIYANLHEKNDYMPECMNYNEYQQALKERNYWREARKFINNNIPQEYGENYQQEQSLCQARRFGRQAYKYIGDIIAKNNWSNTGKKAVGLHGIVGGIIAKMCGEDYLQGEALGKLNKYIVGTICENEVKLGLRYNETLALSEEIGAKLGQSLGLGKQLGKEIAMMATKWNALEHNNENQYRTDLESKVRNHKKFNSLDIDIDSSSNSTLEAYYNGLVATYGDSNTTTPVIENNTLGQESNTTIIKDPVTTTISEQKPNLYNEQYADKIAQSLKGANNGYTNVDNINQDYVDKIKKETPMFGNQTNGQTGQGNIDYTKDPYYSKMVEATQKYNSGHQNVDGMNADQKQDTITMLRGIPYTRVDKDKFNEAVSNTSMGLAGVALLVPGGQGVAAASLTIGSAITVGNNILYEVVYSDSTTKDKVIYVAKETAIEWFSSKYKIGEKFTDFWKNNMHLLKGLPKFKTPTLDEIKRMGEALNIFQNKSTEVLVEKANPRKD